MEQKKNDPLLENVLVLIFRLVWQFRERNRKCKIALHVKTLNQKFRCFKIISEKYSVVFTLDFSLSSLSALNLSCTVSRIRLAYTYIHWRVQFNGICNTLCLFLCPARSRNRILGRERAVTSASLYITYRSLNT